MIYREEKRALLNMVTNLAHASSFCSCINLDYFLCFSCCILQNSRSPLSKVQDVFRMCFPLSQLHIAATLMVGLWSASAFLKLEQCCWNFTLHSKSATLTLDFFPSDKDNLTI